MRPVKPATQVAPKWWALSMQSFQPCRVWRSISWSSSGLPNMPSVEMVMSRLPMASSERLPSSARSCPLVVCQKNGSKLSKPRSAMAAIFSAAWPDVAWIMVPMRMALAGLVMGKFLDCNKDALAGLGAFDRREHHGQAFDIVVARRLGRPALLDGIEEFGEHAGMAMRLVDIGRVGHLDGRKFAQEALVGGHHLGF